MRYTNKRTLSAISFWNSVHKNKERKKKNPVENNMRVYSFARVKPRKVEKRDKVKTVAAVVFPIRGSRYSCCENCEITTLRFPFTILSHTNLSLCDVARRRGVSFCEIPFVRSSSSRRPFVTADPLIILPWLSRHSEQQLANFSRLRLTSWTHPLYMKSQLWLTRQSAFSRERFRER